MAKPAKRTSRPRKTTTTTTTSKRVVIGNPLGLPGFGEDLEDRVDEHDDDDDDHEDLDIEVDLRGQIAPIGPGGVDLGARRARIGRAAARAGYDLSEWLCVCRQHHMDPERVDHDRLREIATYQRAKGKALADGGT